MVVFDEEVEMVKNGQDRSRHGPKGSHRNIPSLPHLYRPRHIGIGYNSGDRELNFKAIKEILKWSFHLGEHSCEEGREVLGSNKFRWDYVGMFLNRTLSGLLSEAMKPDHSSVITNVMRMFIYLNCDQLKV
ncbi:hypothetical protein V6N13_010999 [Hibiscus sabdariffa]|uniref:Uncharacterized protein n=1 Tax=Hibiscus sabdariffa TaxID=183260 RepID=A0ABR2SAV7_9ROSI